MEYAPPPPSPSDLERVVVAPRPSVFVEPPPRNGTKPETTRITRPETMRIRSHLDDVMARLHAKLDGINGDEAEAIASNLDPKATRRACAAFKTEEDPDDVV